MVREFTTPKLAFRSIGDDDSDDTNIGSEENDLEKEIGAEEELEGADEEEGPSRGSEE